MIAVVAGTKFSAVKNFATAVKVCHDAPEKRNKSW